MSKQEDILYDYSSILRPTIMLLDELEPVVSGKGSPISCHIYCKSFAINIQSGSDDRLTLSYTTQLGGSEDFHFGNKIKQEQEKQT